MGDYKKEYLYAITLGKVGDSGDVDRLRNAYEQFRINITELLSIIGDEFPNLTIHDISHVDSLWRIGSLIVGEDYKMNPLEGFILGGAFLLHDAALSVEAYGGEEELRKTHEWKDCYRFQIRKGESDENPELRKEVDFATIRLLHANQAKSLLNKKWRLKDKSEKFLLEDEELRNHYGKIIGEIAASHHLNIEDVKKMSPQLNTIPSLDTKWQINVRKLACIIRCADAAHIDMGRAPDYLFKVLCLNGISYDHWNAQNHLAIIDNDSSDRSGESLLITSTYSFNESDFSAWNVVYDAIQVIDNELEQSNLLLREIDEGSTFKAKHITGAKSRKELSKHVRTEGWQPCEANIHISNINLLIQNLGGDKLYGPNDHLLIVLRELIQNSRDAIIARKNIEVNPDYFGKINVKTTVDEDGSKILIIEDNGIGMSERVITTSFLDFGQSFWSSDLVKTEFLGLMSSDFDSVGEFGIGFYSVFMIASSVTISSKRYDTGLADITTLKFPKGLTISPIINHDIPSEFTSQISTRIIIKIDPNKYNWAENYTILSHRNKAENFEVPIGKVVASICAGLDVDVYYEEEKVHQNILDISFDKRQWLIDISYAEYQKNSEVILESIENNYSRLEFIKEKDKIVGLAAVDTLITDGNSFLSISTVGGLSAAIHGRNSGNYIGFLDFHSNTAKRENSNKMRATPETMKKWCASQIEGIDLQGNALLKYKISGIACTYDIDPFNFGNMLLLEKQGGYYCFSFQDVATYISKGRRVVFLIMGHVDDCMERNYRTISIQEKLENVDLLVCPYIVSGTYTSLKMENEVPTNNNSMIDCLYRATQDINCKIKIRKIEQFAKNNFGENNDALIIEKDCSSE